MTNYSALEKVIAVTTALMAEMESQAFQDEDFAQLSMRQMHYLNTIQMLEEPTFSELAQKLGVTKPSVTAIVSTLIRKDFVEKIQDDSDRRSYHIVLTQQGLRFGQLHDAVHQRMVNILTANLDEDEVKALTRLLSKAIQR